MKWTTNKDFLLSLPLPNDTETYKAVPHKRFIEELKARISSKFKIKEERYLKNKDGSQMNVKFIIDDSENPLFYKVITGVNSYNKSLACRVITGTTCLKGIHTYILQSFNMYHRHTKSVNKELDDYFNMVTMHLHFELQKIIQFKEKCESISINQTDISLLLGNMFLYQDIITSTQISNIKKLIEERNPTNVWDLFNYVTKTYEEFSHSSDYVSNIISIGSFFKEKYKIDLVNNKLKLHYEKEEINP
jgi:hypothetical protein